jgi:dephospho-CoA kinase
MVLGLTGKYCSGKSIAGKIFTARGWLELEVDSFGHDALSARRYDVRKAFGDEVVGHSGEIDRKKLGALVFSDREKLKILESIIHPEMADRCEREIAANSGRNILINAAILHHMSLDRLCDSVLWIESGTISRFVRARKRDGLSVFQIAKRFYSQRQLDAKYWGKDVDTHIIRNSGDKAGFDKEINALIDMFEKRV